MRNIILFIFILFNYFQFGISQTIKPEWVFKANASFFSSPVIDGDIVYTGNLDSNFYAIEIKTGKKLWEFKTYGKIRSTALVKDNYIYFESGDGILYCLSKAGNLVWTFKTGGEKKYDFADYHQSSPIINGNSVFFGSGDGYVYNLNSSDGELIWKYKTGDVVHTTPVTDGTNFYFGSFDGYFYALNIKDGFLKWKFKTTGHKYFPKGEVQGSPAIYKNIVLFGARDY